MVESAAARCDWKSLIFLGPGSQPTASRPRAPFGYAGQRRAGGFNEAAPKRGRKAPPQPEPGPELVSFNEAAPKRGRKGELALEFEDLPPQAQLQ